MWKENYTEEQLSMKEKTQEVIPPLPTPEETFATPLENEEKLAFKPYPIPFTTAKIEDHFLRWERNSNFRQRYFELEELLEYAVENGKLDTPDLAIQVKALKKLLYYTPPESVDELCTAEAELEKLYAIISQLVHPVDIISLRTTSEQYPVERGRWQKKFVFFLGSGSVSSNFFRQFYWVGGILTVWMIFVIILIQKDNQFSAAVAPFLFGAIGAWLYLYKMLTSCATSRLLSRERIGFDWLRLFTGSLIGGLIVLLFRDTTESSGISTAALGLLAGYSVDFFYQTLDQIIHRILLKGRENTPTPPPTPRQQQIESLLKQLKETEDEDDKIAIRNLLEKL